LRASASLRRCSCGGDGHGGVADPGAALQRAVLQQVELEQRPLAADASLIGDRQAAPCVEIGDQFRDRAQLDREIQEIIHRQVRDRNAVAAQRQVRRIRVQVHRLEHFR
jgi:hypothetical protein